MTAIWVPQKHQSIDEWKWKGDMSSQISSVLTDTWRNNCKMSTGISIKGLYHRYINTEINKLDFQRKSLSCL